MKTESNELVRDAILTYSAMPPIKIYETSGGLVTKAKKAWNWFCNFAGIDNLRFKINEKLKELLIRIGFGSKEAEDIAKDREK